MNDAAAGFRPGRQRGLLGHFVNIEFQHILNLHEADIYQTQ